jgi:predicted metal-dependent hydrolase
LIAGKSLQGWLDRADELGAAGRFFDAHEELELAWHAADGEMKILFQGLIQIAAGLHRLKLDPRKIEGALYLLDRGLEKLRQTRALLSPVSLAALEAALGEIRTSGIRPAELRFHLRIAPRAGA